MNLVVKLSKPLLCANSIPHQIKQTYVIIILLKAATGFACDPDKLKHLYDKVCMF